MFQTRMHWCVVTVVALLANSARGESPLDKLDRSLVPDKMPEEVVALLDGPGERLGELAFSDDSSTFATGDANGTIQVWHFKDHQSQKGPAWDAGVGPITAIALGPDGSMLAVAGEKKTLALWECRGEKPCLRAALRDVPPRAITTLLFTPTKTLLASAWGEAVVRIFDFSRGTVWESGRLEHEEDVRKLALSPDGRMLAVGGEGPALSVYELASGKERARFGEDKFGVSAVAFTPDGAVTALYGVGRRRRWSLSSGAELDPQRDYEGDTPSMALSKAGDLVMCATYGLHDLTPGADAKETGVVVWRQDGKRYCAWDFPGLVENTLWAPDGRHVAVVHREGPIFLLRVPSRPWGKRERARLTPIPRTRVY